MAVVQVYEGCGKPQAVVVLVIDRGSDRSECISTSLPWQ